MLFHRIHIDPAVASGPLITTINDLVAVVVYYGLAMVVLIDLFHLHNRCIKQGTPSGGVPCLLRKLLLTMLICPNIVGKY